MPGAKVQTFRPARSIGTVGVYLNLDGATADTRLEVTIGGDDPALSVLAKTLGDRAASPGVRAAHASHPER